MLNDYCGLPQIQLLPEELQPLQIGNMVAGLRDRSLILLKRLVIRL